MEMSDVIAGFALLVSIGSAVLAFRRQKKLDGERFNELELIRAQLSDLKESKNEKRKAKVSAKLIKEGQNHRVRIFNLGPADALNVRVHCHDDGDLASQKQFEQKFPLAKLEAQSSVNVLAFVHQQSSPKHTVTLEWEDPSSSTNTNSVELVL
jgi:hypothetical protein